jgi:trans-aconitate methyltransferase
MNIKKYVNKIVSNPTVDSVKGEEKGEDFYDRIYSASEHYDVHYSRSFYYFIWTVITDRLRRHDIRKVLEIGCGPGQLSILLSEHGVADYTGMDFSSVAIEMARKNNPNGEFFVDDARTTDLHSKVDHEAIICTEVLEHIQDDLQVVSRFTPGKLCLCSVPSFPYESHVRNFETLSEVQDRYAPFFKEMDIIKLMSPKSYSDYFYLIQGIRSEYTIGL